MASPDCISSGTSLRLIPEFTRFLRYSPYVGTLKGWYRALVRGQYHKLRYLAHFSLRSATRAEVRQLKLLVDWTRIPIKKEVVRVVSLPVVQRSARRLASSLACPTRVWDEGDDWSTGSFSRYRAEASIPDSASRPTY